MKALCLSSALVRSASVAAIAAGLVMPAAAVAQAAPAAQTGAEATNAQPTPAQPAPDPQATNAETTGQNTATPNADTVQAAETSDVVVTGIRASLERSIAIKRDSTGIVDAISAEDIGKFPDTNLAESLQRITGVSINRRNGEGADVTVRGFGPQFNLVTLNGRQLATSEQNTVGGDESADFSRNTSRSFDFSNLASEGVRTLEVYKTGRAAIPSGGIGAAINVVTRRPLDSHESGFNGSIGAKAVYDTSSDDCVSCGSHVTPEVSGLASWSNPDQTFGVSLFGAYQKRNFSNISATSNDWNITDYTGFNIPANVGSGATAAKQTNVPSNPATLVARPNDFRYHFGEASRERINAQGVIQFKPTDTLELTVDGLYAQNSLSERRSDQSNWFNKPFDQVTFDSGYSVATTTFLHETIASGSKDAGFEQQYRAQKNKLYDIGANAKWEVTDNFTLAADGHIGRSTSTPNNPNGYSSTLVAISAPILAQHSVDYTGGFPVQTVQFADPAGSKGNGNGTLDLGDLGSQIGRQVATTLTQNIHEGRLDAGWDLGGGARFDFGGEFRDTKTRSTQFTFQQTLGDWGNSLPRDVQARANGLVQDFCLVCRFHEYDPKATGDALKAFRAENPVALYNALSTYYAGLPRGADNKSADQIDHRVLPTGSVDDRVQESIWGGYAQFTWKGQFGSHDATLVTGVRYEKTTVHSLSYQVNPLDIRWQSDNDFTVDLTSTAQALPARGSYDNFLPSMDFQLNIYRNLVGRFSFSRTLSRPSFGDLFASTTAGTPNDATYVGGQASGTTHDANLKPLTSDNLDLSLEWYFKPDSYLSFGVFDKRVHNFIGNTIVKRNLFGLRDPSTGADGSRSGTAKQQLATLGADVSDVNLFAYTALLQKYNGSVANATADFSAHYNTTARQIDQAYYDNTIVPAIDIIADNNDPLFQFNVNTPINNKDAEIYGFEAAGQFFFGNSGIGVSAQYTLVRGDVNIDVAADPNVDQFALLGLSDTANVNLIYDKNGLSARLSYNWRDKFLSAINRDGFHNPEFTAPYGQFDVNVSYDITPKLAVSLEGINLTKEAVKTYARSPNEIWLISEGQARVLGGVRYRF